MAFLSKMWVHLMMIRIDKKSSKSYENAVNFASFQFCSQLELAESTSWVQK